MPNMPKLTKTKTMKTADDNLRLIAVLAVFFAARTVSALSLTSVPSYVTSFLLSAVYIAVFAFSCEKPVRKAFKFFKGGIFFAAFFLSVMIFISYLTDIVFTTSDNVKSDIRSVLVSVFIVPIGEELFFRASLFRIMKKSLNFPIALLFSSLLFALSHTSTGACIAAFVAGIVLAVFYEITGSVSLIIVCHMINNLTATVFYVSDVMRLYLMLLCFLLSLVFAFCIRRVLKNE